MPTENKIYPEAGRHDRQLVHAILKHFPLRAWPNDCPTCGARMEFFFLAPEAEDPRAYRGCPACGESVHAREVLSGEHCEPETPRQPRRSFATKAA